MLRVWDFVNTGAHNDRILAEKTKTLYTILTTTTGFVNALSNPITPTVRATFTDYGPITFVHFQITAAAFMWTAPTILLPKEVFTETTSTNYRTQVLSPPVSAASGLNGNTNGAFCTVDKQGSNPTYLRFNGNSGATVYPSIIISGWFYRD